MPTIDCVLSGEQFNEVEGQLPMFMSAREIMHHFQPNDGDHEPIDEEYAGDRCDHVPCRKAGGACLDSSHGYRTETEDELWNRKAQEATWMEPGLDDDAPSLYESIARHGVQHPVSLQLNPEDTGLLHGKPEVFGGHHRVAVMEYIDPDALMPVMFFPTFKDAIRKNPHY